MSSLVTEALLDENQGRPVNEAIRAEARRLVKENFAQCFWFRDPEATVTTWNDVYLVVEHLREYGGRTQWREAQKLWKTLRACL
ncbi:MAG: hypothetical protein AAGA58_01075 [Verrucomicrobiota bacterium]